MAWTRRMGPLLLAAAVAMAGIAIGAQLQRENALPSDVETQQLANRGAASGNVVFLSSLAVAAGATGAVLALAPPSPGRSRVRPILALMAGAYLVANLAQTAWPNYAAAQAGHVRRANLQVNFLASDGGALPSVLVPVLALWVVSLALVLWGAARLLRPPSSATTGRLLQQQVGLVLLAAPFLGLAFWGCLRLMVALPPVPGATIYRVLLSLNALAYLGLLVAAAAKAWHLMRAARDRRLSPLALEAWEGLGRAEVGLAGLLAVLALSLVFLPAFPPPTPSCSPLDAGASTPCQLADPTVQHHDELQEVAGLLQSGQTFGTRLVHVHLGLLLTALVPLAPAIALHRRGMRLLDEPGTDATVHPAWTPVAAGAVIVSLALGGLATWWDAGTLLAWVAAAVPVALAARLLADPSRQVLTILLAAWAAWCLGNTLAAQFNTQASGSAILHFTTSTSGTALWRLAGAFLAAWAIVRLLRAAAGDAKASTVIPLAGGTAAAALAVAMLELTLEIWTSPWTNFRTGTTHASSVYVGTWVTGLDPAVAAVVHGLAMGLAIASAAMVARLVRPEWFRRGRRPDPSPNEHGLAFAPA